MSTCEVLPTAKMTDDHFMNPCILIRRRQSRLFWPGQKTMPMRPKRVGILHPVRLLGTLRMGWVSRWCKVQSGWIMMEVHSVNTKYIYIHICMFCHVQIELNSAVALSQRSQQLLAPMLGNRPLAIASRGLGHVNGSYN